MTAPSPTVRDETPSDVDAIRRVVLSAFPTPLESRLVDRLRENGRLTISLVAESGGHVVGHIAFSPVTVAGSDTGGLGLAPLSVAPECQIIGIGGALVRAGLDMCRRLGVPFAVVLGEPDYYRRFGFLPAATRGLFDAYGGGDAFAAIELAPRGIPGGGRVDYVPEFSEFTDAA
ncbi:MAG: GNAT family N-acetyltransferase [Planctomycetota bacterium]|nr:MAG: GNAT family N-acetyltransferase [Planctomycetota bacterium]